ncbi:hypothetical protein PVAND_011640 [Polypedilum vanderplanki]|uniref:Sarcosine dehydrogenase n=1 Tax=Polypedilum vanderplanki TaxID=319348 RepID=A0A9J6CJY7_POLVA|nr:hypothetical protein PVAND_011640 [Polypedilum vanderplanki]
MLRFKRKFIDCIKIQRKQFVRCFSTPTSLPEYADVVIIGGGVAGCSTLYQLTKRNVNAVLLERGQLTCGTTWHTAGLVWRLRPNDVEIQLLATTRELLMSLESETGLNSGWINNGGLFISHSPQRTNEYRRLQTLGKSFGIESRILSPLEVQKEVFPLLDPKSFENALFSPGDGVVDPAMLCTALTRAATSNGGRVFENCAVDELIVGKTFLGDREIRGVKTQNGIIKTNTVVNATGVWGKDLLEPLDIHLPLVPMRHAYVVSEAIKEVQGMPNVRDHDYSLYFRIQGQSIQMGGYENNPILLDKVPADFQFGLYDLDYSVFDTHIEGAVKLCPTFGQAGIKSTICGPESFTPDHKPLMGPDPILSGLFHSCGYNSAGMMLSAGCAKQLASWIIHDRPDLHLFAYDIRRFTPRQRKAYTWAIERSHEAYAKNYSIVFPNDQPLAGRNFIQDPFHKILVNYGAVMEEKSGFERPGYYIHDGIAPVQKYDYYGYYGREKNKNTCYAEKLAGDYKFEFSDHHDLISEEAHSCRENAVVFNLSYFCKVFITGSQAEEAAKWIFTADLNKPFNKTIYTCALNNRGGVEIDLTVTGIESGVGELHDPIFKGRGYYAVCGGASSYHSIAHMQEAIREKGFRAKLCDVTHELGILSLQGPKSRDILSLITDYDLSNENMPPNSAAIMKIKGLKGEVFNVRVLRVSFVGELGFELHIPKESCAHVYNILMHAGGSFNLKNAGYRSLYSLSSEKGYHLWGFDLRSDDTPIEANLGFVCRKDAVSYKGKEVILEQQRNGTQKRLVYLTLKEKIPLWGLEAVYRNNKIVGHLRRGEFAYILDCSLGQCYIKRTDSKAIDIDYIMSGKYQIEVMGKLYDADIHLRSPFDPKGRRILGEYKS